MRSRESARRADRGGGQSGSAAVSRTTGMSCQERVEAAASELPRPRTDIRYHEGEHSKREVGGHGKGLRSYKSSYAGALRKCMGTRALVGDATTNPAFEGRFLELARCLRGG